MKNVTMHRLCRKDLLSVLQIKLRVAPGNQITSDLTCTNIPAQRAGGVGGGWRGRGGHRSHKFSFLLVTNLFTQSLLCIYLYITSSHSLPPPPSPPPPVRQRVPVQRQRQDPPVSPAAAALPEIHLRGAASFQNHKEVGPPLRGEPITRLHPNSIRETDQLPRMYVEPGGLMLACLILHTCLPAGVFPSLKPRSGRRRDYRESLL